MRKYCCGRFGRDFFCGGWVQAVSIACGVARRSDCALSHEPDADAVRPFFCFEVTDFFSLPVFVSRPHGARAPLRDSFCFFLSFPTPFGFCVSFFFFSPGRMRMRMGCTRGRRLAAAALCGAAGRRLGSERRARQAAHLRLAASKRRYRTGRFSPAPPFFLVSCFISFRLVSPLVSGTGSGTDSLGDRM